jgi:transcriptional regulator GlxA family with amidase domain
MVMKRALWVIGLSLSALVGIVLTGLVGLVFSASLIMASPDPAAGATVASASAAQHDPTKPTVAVVLGDTRTEATDFLAPYAMFAASGAYNVYAVADTTAVRTLAGGVDVIPQLTFAELDARTQGRPEVILVPAMKDIASPKNVPVLDWLRAHRGSGTLFSWCVGAEVLAASGLIDGRPVTTHWSDIDGLEHTYPAVDWQRGVRYVDDGDLVTTGGITAGVDGTLHFLATRNGQAVADRVAAAMHYPASPFVDDPRASQYTLEPVDAAVYLNMGFNWPKPSAGVWLYDGVGEIDLAAAVEAFGVTSANLTTTMGSMASVTSQHGLQLVPRRQADDLGTVDRMIVPGGHGAEAAAARIPSALVPTDRQPTVLQNDAEPTYAFALALEELAASDDVLIAQYDARQLEVRVPLELVGRPWNVKVVLVPLLAGLAAILTFFCAVALASRMRNSWRRRAGGHVTVGDALAAR